MSLLSMTGYGRAAFRAGDSELAVEVNAVNRRGLEVSATGPEAWAGAGLERIVTPWIRECCERGKIALAVRAQSGAGETAALAWDRDAVTRSVRALEEQSERDGHAFKPGAETYLRLAELHRMRHAATPGLDDEATLSAFKTAADAALAGLVAMRRREGAAIEADLRARLSTLAGLVDAVRAYAAENVGRYRDALLARLRQAGLDLDPGDDRVLKELALFADRCDISEELTRLASHFEQFVASFAEKAVGRKLDFLCQEINRELNTVGSKANRVEITRAVIEAKNELERIREQVQNVE